MYSRAFAVARSQDKTMGSSPAPTLKADIWMPLDIGRYLQDTAHLTTEESGAYLHLLMHYWTYGPLPNDHKKLRTIARMSADAWSIAFASLSMFFFTGPDGLLHQRGADRRRERWIDKRQKAHDKAVNAANARWGKRKRTDGEPKENTGDAPSITHAMPVTTLSTTPQGDSPSAHPPAPRGEATRPGAPSIPTRPQPIPTKSESKAKTPKPAPVAPAERPDARNHAAHRSVAATGKENSAAHTNKNGANPPKTPSGVDGRYEAFRREVFAFWSGQNPAGENCPWIPADRKAMRGFLAGAPSMTLEQFKRLLRTRAHSEIVASDPPRLWLRDLMRYASGPLDRFKKPLRVARSL
jgi:uncharacterized protein YdaU (DUF1376 family)